jgi:hypothetical protein
MPIDISGQPHDSCLTMTRLLPSLLPRLYDFDLISLG